MLHVDPERLKATRTGFHCQALYNGKMAKCDAGQLTKESFLEWFIGQGKPIHNSVSIMMIVLGYKGLTLDELVEVRSMRISDEELTEGKSSHS